MFTPLRSRTAWSSLLLALLLVGCAVGLTSLPHGAAPPEQGAVEAREAETRALTRPANAEGPTTGGQETAIRRVIVVSIDGLRPRDLLRARAPHVQRMMAEGASSTTVQTVLPSVTLPAHASMLGGLPPQEHGVLWNDWEPHRGYLRAPTIFTVAREHGVRTAMVVNKFKLRHLSLGTDVFIHPGTTALSAVQAALPLLSEEGPVLLFLHFADPDSAGHAHGWGSPAYLEAIAQCDVAVGSLLEAVERAGLAESTLWIVTADHGGHDRAHGSAHPDDVTIPWLAYGPGVPPGLVIERPISIMDTGPTALAALGLPVPDGWHGQPVWEVLPERAGARAP